MSSFRIAHPLLLGFSWRDSISAFGLPHPLSSDFCLGVGQPGQAVFRFTIIWESIIVITRERWAEVIEII